MSVTTEYPRATRVLAHISDVHLRDFGSLLYEEIDAEAALVRALQKLVLMGVAPDALVFTGDLADFAEDGAYRTLRVLVDDVAGRLGTETIWVMGNHDDRGLFRQRMLDQAPTTNPVDMVHDIGGLRIIALDTTVPGHHHGALTPEQLDWLADTLAQPAEHGTILAMHHPPIPMINDATVAVELRGQAELAAVVRGTDVRSILAGHLHYATHALFAGIPVSVATSTCYTQDLTVPRHSLRPSDGSTGFNLVHLYEDTIVHTIVPVDGGTGMDTTTAEQTRANLTFDNIVIKGTLA